MLSLLPAIALLWSPPQNPLAIPAMTYQEARNYVCYKVAEPISIDGRLDESEWGEIPWTALFVDIEGDAKPRPRFETRAKMAWDDDYFYFAAALKEPHVWGTLTEHDSVIFRDNDFEVFIDPDGDNHQYYEFEINALNTGWDLRLVKPYRDGGPALNEWEIPGLKTGIGIRGTLNDPTDVDEGWSVEIAMPWEVLAEFTETSCPPEPGNSWKVNFSRVEWKHLIVDGKYQKVPNTREDNWVWSPQGVIDMHRPERWGYVQFTDPPVGQATFKPDADAAARDLLHQIYYAQKNHHRQNGTWIESLDDLGIEIPDSYGDLRLELNDEGYVAAIERPAEADLPARLLQIRQDSLVQVIPLP